MYKAAAIADDGRNRVPDIIGAIKDAYSRLRPAEQAVANAVLSDVKSAVAASNAEIAERAGVSQPTVTRFCRAIGCSGVRDFKLRLAQSLAVGAAFLAADAPGPSNGHANGEVPPFWTSILTEARAALREVERQLDPDRVTEAAEALAGAGRVVAVGMGGSSATLAEETRIRLFRYGVPAVACADPHLARMTAATLKPGDVLLVFSATGRTPELIDTVAIARRYGARAIAVTTPASLLSEACDIALTVRIAEYPDALTPSASRFAFLAILDMVAAATGYRLGPAARENLRRIKFNIMDPASGDRLEPLGD